MNEKSKQIPIGFSDRQREMITELQGQFGITTIAGLVSYLIAEKYSQLKAQPFVVRGEAKIDKAIMEPGGVIELPEDNKPE